MGGGEPRASFGGGRGGAALSGDAVCGAQRRSSLLVVASNQHVDLRHGFSEVGRLLPADVVGGRVRGQLDAVPKPVELDVLLQVLGLKHSVGRVACDAEQLVRVEMHDLVQVLLEDHDRSAGVLVCTDQGEVLPGEADDAIHGCAKAAREEARDCSCARARRWGEQQGQSSSLTRAGHRARGLQDRRTTHSSAAAPS